MALLKKWILRRQPRSPIRFPFRRLEGLRLCGWCLAALLLTVPPAESAPGAAEDLVAAVQAGDLSGVRALIEGGASPDSRDAEGVPVLALAAGEGKAELVSLLLAKGASSSTGAPDEDESAIGRKPRPRKP